VSDPGHEIGVAAAQTTPSLTAVVMLVSGHDVNYWVGIAGLIFIALQGAYLVWKWRRDIRRDRADLDPAGD